MGREVSQEWGVSQGGGRKAREDGCKPGRGVSQREG